MVNKPGDETRRHGQYVDLVDADAAEEGDVVAVDENGNPTPALEGDAVLGVFYRGPESGGDKATVKTLGTVIAKVAEGTVAGESLGSPDETNGERVGCYGHADDQGVIALEDASNDYEYKNLTDGPWAEVMVR